MDTLEVYWSILEAGICFLAVNLPSLWPYGAKISPERMLASIRSIISLGSMHSDRSPRSGLSGHQPLDGESVNSKSSGLHLAPAENTEAHITYDVEAQKTIPPPGAIEVNSTVQQITTNL